MRGESAPHICASRLSVDRVMYDDVRYIERIKVNVRRKLPLSRRASLPFLPALLFWLSARPIFLNLSIFLAFRAEQLERIDTKTHRIDTRIDIADCRGSSSSSAASVRFTVPLFPVAIHYCRPLRFMRRAQRPLPREMRGGLDPAVTPECLDPDDCELCF